MKKYKQRRLKARFLGHLVTHVPFSKAKVDVHNIDYQMLYRSHYLHNQQSVGGLGHDTMQP